MSMPWFWRRYEQKLINLHEYVLRVDILILFFNIQIIKSLPFYVFCLKCYYITRGDILVLHFKKDFTLEHSFLNGNILSSNMINQFVS